MRKRPRPRPKPDRVQTLTPVLVTCPECQHRLHARYHNFRTVTTLDGVFRLTLTIRRCPNPDCPRFLRPYRPEAEPHFALPYHEFGLDVMTLVGRLRYAEHRSIPEIHRELTGRGLVVAERTVTNLLDRYDELRALATADPKRLEPLLRHQRRVVLAIDGLQPDVGHEVLWVLRDCLSGEILLAQSLLSSTAKDLAGLITQVCQALPVPITGVISDGQDSIRKAVARALPGVPHQLCHFHYLREAAKPIYEADRHAKKGLKKRVRGIRPIERQAEKTQEKDPDNEEAEIVRGYCAAVRAALTDDGRPPLAASGLKLHGRLNQIAASLDHVAALAGSLPGGLKRLQQLLRRGLEETASLWPAVQEAYKWVKRVARILKNKEKLPAKKVRRRLVQLLVRMRQAATTAGVPAVGESLRHFLKVTKSYWPGLFRCYDSPDLPRTNNDLEHAFGSHRYHERRSSGRSRASPGLVVMGSARVISGMATRLRPEEGLVLPPGYVEDWQELRAALEQRRESRRQQRRFRHDPASYLKELERLSLQLLLPS
ncbi:MAG TPA: ISNCY family transposase [Isosphaeraceae bacterium]|nr:ISNCY family transposase [Isosphaeraceae bacterium]